MRMQVLTIDIETHDRELGYDLAGTEDATGTLRTLNAGIVSIPGGQDIEFRGTLMRKSMDFPMVLQFIVDTSINVEYGLIATWLAGKCTSKNVERIIINRRVVTEITSEGIRQVIEEEIRISQ